MADDQTINLPQLVIILLLGGFAVRYFFFSTPQSPGQQSTSSRGGVRVRDADVDRVQQMFPQVGRRTIMWDLQRNGGNIAATTERILSGRGLEEPPQTFRPPMPPAAASSSSQAGTRTETPKPSQPDLIARYNLAEKLAAATSEDKETPEGSPSRSPGGTKAWSQNKTERQSLMQQRREEMILAARRKMEAKIAAENKS
ncbi:hypothetical protein V498_04203 [Pseudogymnoascus sp. VKM F-4517 (FW-2822)]|nr:hypothetical protein V498_04203 [Pseudogymnoascus sp. VKM F-4517 (FW-2822)]